MTGALTVAEKSYPMSEVRGRNREDSMPEGWRPRRVTPRPRSGAAAESARLQRRRNGGEELPKSKSGTVAGRSNPTPEARGGSQEDQLHIQGNVAVWAQEGLEELSHVEGQKGRQ